MTTVFTAAILLAAVALLVGGYVIGYLHGKGH